MGNGPLLAVIGAMHVRCTECEAAAGAESQGIICVSNEVVQSGGNGGSFYRSVEGPELCATLHRHERGVEATGIETHQSAKAQSAEGMPHGGVGEWAHAVGLAVGAVHFSDGQVNRKLVQITHQQVTFSQLQLVAAEGRDGAGTKALLRIVQHFHVACQPAVDGGGDAQLYRMDDRLADGLPDFIVCCGVAHQVGKLAVGVGFLIVHNGNDGCPQVEVSRFQLPFFQGIQQNGGLSQILVSFQHLVRKGRIQTDEAARRICR